jgi:fructan beta-fructosidase
MKRNPERLRPLYHFTAAENWLNDPNGLVFDGELYHLFFQRNPRGRRWGNMTWGQAIGRDLVSWTQVEDALLPDAMGTMFSGSAVMDRGDSAGFKRGGRDPLILVYTAAGSTSFESAGKPFVQCLAWSDDGGRSFEKYAGNPVLGPQAFGNRDPKLIRHEGSGRWIMSLYLNASSFALFASEDLKRWRRLQTVEVPGSSECPDFFPLGDEGDWVFVAADGRYLVGDFDGERFAPRSHPRCSEAGPNFYACQTWSDLPASDGRRVQIAWMKGGKYPGAAFNQQMSFPRELSLSPSPSGPRLRSAPAREIGSLRGPASSVSGEVVGSGRDPFLGLEGEAFDIEAEIECGRADEVGLFLRGTRVAYDVRRRMLRCLGRAIPLEARGGLISLRVLLDRTSIEIFAPGDPSSLSGCFLPPEKDRRIGFYAKGGRARVAAATAWELSRPAASDLLG